MDGSEGGHNAAMTQFCLCFLSSFVVALEAVWWCGKPVHKAVLAEV